jgi:hypothetical protein
MACVEHILGLNRFSHLVMDEMIKTGFAKGRIVPRQLHHGFGFAFGAVHDGYGSYEPSEMNANGNTAAGVHDRSRSVHAAGESIIQ